MRVIASLRLDLEAGQSGTRLQLIAPIDDAGRSRHCRSLSPRKRLVDLGTGELVLHQGKIYRIRGVEPSGWHEAVSQTLRETDSHTGKALPAF